MNSFFSIYSKISFVAAFDVVLNLCFSVGSVSLNFEVSLISPWIVGKLSLLKVVLANELEIYCYTSSSISNYIDLLSI